MYRYIYLKNLTTSQLQCIHSYRFWGNINLKPYSGMNFKGLWLKTKLDIFGHIGLKFVDDCTVNRLVNLFNTPYFVTKVAKRYCWKLFSSL